jgi:putative peptide zinc metalloprotease protein
VAIVVDVPVRPDGLALIGEMVGSGYRTPPSLVRRQDGQTLQLTPLLYAVLEAVDGRRGYAEIAQEVSARTRRSVSASDVETLVQRKLRPLGLLLSPDGTVPRLKRSNPLTALRFKYAVSNPVLTRRLTGPFAALFHWWVWLPLLAAFGWVSWWLLMDHGLASATYHAFAKPNLLMLVVVVAVLSAGFHEFGHAAAARRGGAQPGAMGAGWYLLWPAFYTDVTDTYRLGRFARIRTDLGGLYFNAIAAVVMTGVWWVTGWDALLLVVAAQILQMVRQLTPLVRFDGYHVLADLTGVPDLFSRIGPILASFWPTRWGDPRVAQLKWWARLVVTAWVLFVVPILALAVVALVLAVPRVIGTAIESLGREWDKAALHWSSGQTLDAVGAVLGIGAIAFPVVAVTLMLSRTIGKVGARIWRRTAGRPVQRAGAGALAVALAAVLAFVWWPSPDRYRPIRPYEGGTLQDVAAPLAAMAQQGSLQPGADIALSADGGEMVTVLPGTAPLPTEEEPQLALVLVPTSTPGGEAGTAADGTTPPDGTTTPAEPGWVFPFNEPPPPEPGDNQALAVNTTDGSATYDVAIAMVWVTDDDPVLNVNEAYAFASCADCVTVAVAFQVVVIVGSADVIVPQNLSAAVNYDCFACITASIASQLVVTVDSLPDVEQQIALADLWDDLTAFATSIPTLPLADVISRLDEYKDQIVSILGVAPLASSSLTSVPSDEPSASASASAPATATPAQSTTASNSSTPVPSDSPAPMPVFEPPSSPTMTPTETATPEPTSGAASEPTASPEPSESFTPTPAPEPEAS